MLKNLFIFNLIFGVDFYGRKKIIREDDELYLFFLHNKEKSIESSVDKHTYGYMLLVEQKNIEKYLIN